MADRETKLSAYNLFRRRNEPDLCCAVLQDRPVPAFVEADAWEFGGTVGDGESAVPTGFKAEAAKMATVLTGFYLFQVLRA